MRVGWETPRILVPPPLVYLAAVVAGWMLSRAFPLIEPAPPFWLRSAFGLALVLIGVGLDAWALLTLVRARTTYLPWGRASALVTGGPFRLSRNPIYLGYALTALGVASILGSLWAVLLLAPAIGIMHVVIIPREERHLAERFGGEYEEYRRRVRRWI